MLIQNFVPISFVGKINRSLKLIVTISCYFSTMSEPPAKKPRFSESAFVRAIADKRLKTAKDVCDFKFNKKRVRILNGTEEVADDMKGVVYWMSRDQRIQDNWAMLFAQKQALKHKVPLLVVYVLTPTYLQYTMRQYEFLLQGMKEVESECRLLDISFHLLTGNATGTVPDFVKSHGIGCVVTDFCPLRDSKKSVIDVCEALTGVPVVQVDAHNIIPCWITSDKQEYAARTIRTKVNSKLDEYLTEFPAVVKHKYPPKVPDQKTDWKKARSSLKVDVSVVPVEWAMGGTTNGLNMFESFLTKRLKLFNESRNDPTKNALSNMSPWFHFGHVSVQRCILLVKEYKKSHPKSVEAFIEEAVVRRELSDNFCFYQENYDAIEGTANWAQETLKIHAKDKREYLYSQKSLETAKTYDDLWNSAQIQLTKEGKLHGFLRMYWAKKILEWSASPEEALKTALYFNDRYALDGTDPNGYVGCMWSICGIHDQGWKERDVFGKIRYMNYQGCKRKFDINTFISRYGGKSHKYDRKTMS